MKKLLIYIGLIACLVLGSIFLLTQTSRYKVISKNASAYALIANVTEFSREFKRLPNEWSEFSQWYKEKHPKVDYSKSKILNNFTLAWGVKVKDIQNSDVLIEVNDVDLMPYSSNLNEALKRQLKAIENS